MHKSPFLENVRTAARLKHMSTRIEDSYVNWIKRFILFLFSTQHDFQEAPG